MRVAEVVDLPRYHVGVTDDGIVFVKDVGMNIILPQKADQNGILRVKLRTRAEQKSHERTDVAVHKILYEAFVGPLPDGHMVIFANGNLADFNLDNLECIPKKKYYAK